VTRLLVGVVAGRSPADRYSIHQGYVSAVALAGGNPIVIPAGPGLDPGWGIAVLERCESVVFTGGGDVALGHATASKDPDPARDEVELVLARWAIRARRRVLGICRGAQLLAMATGGSLVADLPTAGCEGHWMEERQYEPVHDVKAEPRSLAAEVLGAVTEVNSIHHQAVADPGPLLRPTAWAPDGVIEALEGPSVLGVQWHPERLVATDPRHLGPFSWAAEG
jgi:putative glutamine amidotransferase